MSGTDSLESDGGDRETEARDETAETDSTDGSRLGRRASELVPTVVRRSYRTKFVISIVAILLVLSVVGGAGYVDAERTVEADAERQLTATVDTHADSINEWTVTMESHVRSLSGSADLAGTDAETAESRVIQSQAELPVDVRAIHVVDTDAGRVLTSTDGDLRGQSTAAIDEPWTEIESGVDLTATNDVWRSETAYQDDVVDDQVISFASPVEGDESRIVVLVGTIEYRVDGLRQLHDDQETMIVNTDGETVLASSDLDTDPNPELVDELGTVRRGTAFERDGDLVTAYAATADNDWVAVTTVPAAQAFAASDAVGWSLLSVIGSGLIALVVGGFVLARQTVTPLGDLRNRVKRIENGDRSVDLSTGRIDEIGQLYRAFDEMRDSLETRITEATAAQREAETARESAEEAQAVAEEATVEAEAERERMAERTAELQRVVDRYGETMRAAANGDLTVRATVRTDNEQMREIGEEFNAMLDEIESAIADVAAFADAVATASRDVNDSSVEVKRAGEQVAESIQEISDASDRQREQLQTVDTEMSALSASTEEITSTASGVATVAERTVDSSQRGRSAAEVAIEEMSAVETEAERAVETIQSLEAEVEQIDELVEAIADIAEQTNLLALNASIEATRATDGTVGGFDMVAQEIKNLSSDAKETTAEIEARTATIREQTGESVAVVERTSTRVAEGTEAVKPAVESLEEITEYANETHDGVREISDATDEQASSTVDVVTAVDEVTRRSEESAAEAANVSAAAEEQTASLTQVTGNVSTLAERASALSESLERFETSERVGADETKRAALRP